METDDSTAGAGCLILIAIVLIAIGSAYTWGPAALVAFGAILFLMALLS